MASLVEGRYHSHSFHIVYKNVYLRYIDISKTVHLSRHGLADPGRDRNSIASIHKFLWIIKEKQRTMQLLNMYLVQMLWRFLFLAGNVEASFSYFITWEEDKNNININNRKKLTYSIPLLAESRSTQWI